MINIINFSKRPAHKKHVNALRVFIKRHGIKEASFFNSKYIFYQTTHPKNVPLMLLAVVLRKVNIFYYHEPCFLIEKLKKGNSLSYSLAVKFTQFFEFYLSNFVIVSSSFIKIKVQKMHFTKEIIVVPLCIPDEDHFQLQRDIDILFIGRAAPDQRNLGAFKKLANLLPGNKFCILSADPVEFTSKNLLNLTGKRFTESERIEYLCRSKYVWNVYSSNYNQSGVVPDALQHGCSIFISRYERDKGLVNSSVSSFINPNNERYVVDVMDCLESWSPQRASNSRDLYRGTYSPLGYNSLLDIIKR